MNLIIKQATIIDPQSAFHKTIVDIEIRDGIIRKIATEINSDDDLTIINLPNLHVSQGWFDSSVSFGEPGFEDRETIENGINVAALSGFTDVVLQPNTFPVADNQSQIHFIKSKFNHSGVNVHPVGAFTKNSEGVDLAELFDMQNAGAVAFGDYNKSIENVNLLKIGLQYAQDFNGLLITFCQDKNLAKNGVANEGVVATGLGLKGIPDLSEALQVSRNLALLEYTGGQLHIPTISCEKSVDLIRQAKAKGLQVSCSVTVHHLVFTDAVLTEFDTSYKVWPPLRTEIDRQALLQGVKDGTIDMITTDHNPIDIEHKNLEFDFAMAGTIGLEAAFGALMTVLPLDLIIDKLTSARAVFSKNLTLLQEGQAASLTLFTTEGDYKFSKSDILSKSANAAFLNRQMKGRVYGIINNNKIILSKHAR